MSLEAILGEIIRRAQDSRIQDVWTALPGKVLAYNASAQTVDVEPQIRRPVPSVDGDVLFKDLPVISNVPVAFPRGSGGGFAITWPIEPGDYVWIQVCTNAIGNWRRTGEVSDPGDVRTHSLGACFAIPGAFPNAGTLTQAQIAALVLEGPEIRLGKDATDYAALSSKVDANFNAILDMFANWAPVANDGGAALKSLSSSLTFEPVAAEKTKVE